jgi:hypothetical protein
MSCSSVRHWLTRLIEGAYHTGLIERGKGRFNGGLKRVLAQADDLLETSTIDSQYELWGWLDKLVMSNGETPSVEGVNNVCIPHVGVPILS